MDINDLLEIFTRTFALFQYNRLYKITVYKNSSKLSYLDAQIHRVHLRVIFRLSRLKLNSETILFLCSKDKSLSGGFPGRNSSFFFFLYVIFTVLKYSVIYISFFHIHRHKCCVNVVYRFSFYRSTIKSERRSVTKNFRKPFLYACLCAPAPALAEDLRLFYEEMNMVTYLSV